MTIKDLLTDLKRHLKQNKLRTFYIVKINRVTVYFTEFEYNVETKSIDFYNNKILTTTIWNNNLIEYRIVY